MCPMRHMVGVELECLWKTAALLVVLVAARRFPNPTTIVPLMEVENFSTSVRDDDSMTMRRPIGAPLFSWCPW